MALESLNSRGKVNATLKNFLFIVVSHQVPELSSDFTITFTWINLA